MSDVQALVKNLEFKKAVVGGFEKEAVYAAMKEFAAIYQKEITQLRTEKTQLEKDYKSVSSQLNKANSEIQLLKYQLEQGQKDQHQCEQKFNTFALTIDAVNADKERIINQAKKTADGIIAEATEKYKLASEECLARKQQMEIINANISSVKQRFGITMDSMHSILSHLLSAIEEAQSGGIERQSYGEDEVISLIEQMAGSVNQNDSRKQSHRI